MNGMTDFLSERARRSRAAFEPRFPDLCKAIGELAPAASVVTGSFEGGDLNLDLGHTKLYRGGAIAFAEAQLAAWREQPGRFYMEPPVLREPPPQQQDAIAGALYGHFRGREIPAVPQGSTIDAGGYMVVYGIGLGLHLPALFAEAPVRHFVLVEEHLEFFRHSLGIVEWAGILDRLDETGQTLNIIVGKDPGVVAARVHWLLRGRGFGLIDGSFLYRHYRSTLLDLAYQDFVKNLPLLPISIGFWEDETVMVTNGTVNLARYDFQLLDLRPRLEKGVPAFLVGSGPSLDRTIETLRKYADRAIIFSAGTSLQPLLRNGIRPDFHCELENGWNSVEHLRRTAQKFSLDGITLIASTTVHTEMPSLFGQRILYFRDSVSSTPLWCPDGQGIHGTAPTCTNLALRAALVLAFREIYLFGIDLGTRRAGQHHARDAIYQEVPEWLRDQETDPVRAMTIEMPGNFGGKAYTNQILHWARMMMAQAIDAFSNARIFNCSDGVQIPGTLPRLAHKVEFEGSPARKAAALARIRGELESRRAGEMVPAEKQSAFRRAVADHYAAMRDEIGRSLGDGCDFVAFYERMQPLLARRGADPFQPVLRAFNIGTIMMCFQIGYFFYRRVPDSERPGVLHVFLTALSRQLADMATRSDEILRSVEAQTAAVP
jgi:hypothetical protein